MKLTLFGCGLVPIMLAVSPAAAQHHGAGPVRAHSPGAPSPYAGMEQRRIKALSEQQIADLRAGRGMGLALAAELNGYPGPMHVLELADALELVAEQRSRTLALFEAMKAETIPIGERLIAEEAALDRLFADRRVTRASLDAATCAHCRRARRVAGGASALPPCHGRGAHAGPNCALRRSCAATRRPAITGAGRKAH